MVDRALGTGSIVDRKYELVERLSPAGTGQGVVWKACRRADRLYVAVKLFWADNPAAAARAVDTEARALRQIEPNRHVARFLDSGIADGHPYVVTQLVTGRDLQAVVYQQGRLTDAQLRSAAVGSLMALDACHRSGIVHRDVKPSNLVINEATGDVVLVDFGVSVSLLASTIEAQGRTPHFMAPEFDMPKPPVASDVFSWAATMVYLATGRFAFANDLPANAAAVRILEAFRDRRPGPRARRPAGVVATDVRPGVRVEPGRPADRGPTARQHGRRHRHRVPRGIVRHADRGPAADGTTAPDTAPVVAAAAAARSRPDPDATVAIVARPPLGTRSRSPRRHSSAGSSCPVRWRGARWPPPSSRRPVCWRSSDRRRRRRQCAGGGGGGPRDGWAGHRPASGPSWCRPSKGRWPASCSPWCWRGPSSGRCPTRRRRRGPCSWSWSPSDCSCRPSCRVGGSSAIGSTGPPPGCSSRAPAGPSPWPSCSCGPRARPTSRSFGRLVPWWAAMVIGVAIALWGALGTVVVRSATDLPRGPDRRGRHRCGLWSSGASCAIRRPA